MSRISRSRRLAAPRRGPDLAFSLLAAPTSWQDQGACRDQAPDLFFPEDETEVQQAEKACAVCAACPVAALCLAYALENPGLEGIWGGTTTWERMTEGARRREQWRQRKAQRRQAAESGQVAA